MSGWRWYAALLRRRRWALAGIVALGAVSPLASLPALWLIRHALDTAIPARDTAAILLTGAGVLVFRLASAGVSIALARRAAGAVRAIANDMRNELMARLHRLRWSDRDLVEDARAHSRIIAETDRIDQMTHALFHSALPALLPVLIYTAVLATLSPALTLILLLVTPLLRWLGWRGALPLKRAVAAFQGAFERFHMATHRAIHMLPVTRAQASEPAALADYRSHADALAAAGADMAAAGVLNAQASGVMATIVAAIILVAGGIAVAEGAMTTGALAAFFVAATQANGAVSALAGSAPALFTGGEALRRLEELRAIGSEETAGTRRPDFAAPLTIEAVHFAHPGRSVLIGASMRIEPGRVTAIAAPNGEGKSTLLELVLGLLAPSAGRVRLGADDVTALDPTLYRGRIGLLPQHPRFFRGTVRENVLFGRAAVEEAALARAVDAAGLTPVLANLPLGLDAPMGDGGQLLSGGERQRVALARAFVHAPELLVLDEPSNHLDEEAVALMIEQLGGAPGGPAILIASHDPRLLAIADRVYDLAGGRLVQRTAMRLAASS